jgi:hypothetical protein
MTESETARSQPRSRSPKARFISYTPEELVNLPDNIPPHTEYQKCDSEIFRVPHSEHHAFRNLPHIQIINFQDYRRDDPKPPTRDSKNVKFAKRLLQLILTLGGMLVACLFDN